MIMRILIGLAMIVFAAGFTWFAAQVIWLGTKEFFRLHHLTPKSEIETNENNNETKENK